MSAFPDSGLWDDMGRRANTGEINHQQAVLERRRRMAEPPELPDYNQRTAARGGAPVPPNLITTKAELLPQTAPQTAVPPGKVPDS